MQDWKKEEFERMLGDVARRCMLDPEFRALALKDSTKAISKVCEKPLPKGINFKFIDNSGRTKTIPLPDPIPELCSEVRDEELDHVAGGDLDAVQGQTALWAQWSR